MCGLPKRFDERGPDRIRLAVAFAEAVAEEDFDLAERWAEAAWRRMEQREAAR
jgi:hypothetical protein